MTAPVSIELERLAAPMEEAEQVVAQSERLCAHRGLLVVAPLRGAAPIHADPRRLPGILRRRLDWTQKRPASPLI